MQRFCQHCGGGLEADGACARCAEDPSARLVGSHIDGRYEVRRALGQGAMGVVHEVRHTRLNKSFAMKVIHHDLTRLPGLEARFEREALSSSQLDHPNCIRVTDFGQTSDGSLYLVMELLHGRTLEQAMSGGAMPEEQALELTRQVLAGLDHAHRSGVIHRDVKPANVMLVGNGDEARAVLLDFGIARIQAGVAEDKQITQDNMILGTPEYMAPEQALRADVDQRADLYAVGVMLWQMLTGQPLFEEEEAMAQIAAKLSRPAPDLQEVMPGAFSGIMAALLRRALATKPEERYSSAAEMLEALEQVADQPAADQPAADQPAADQPAADQPAADQPAADQPSAAVTLARAPVAPQPGSGPGRRTILALLALVVLSAGVISMVVLGLVTMASSTSDRPVPAAGAPPEPPPAKQPHPVAAVREGSEERQLLQQQLQQAQKKIGRKACREASLDLQNLLRDKPTLARAHYLLGAAMICRRRYSQAVAAYRRAMELQPRYQGDARILEDAQRMLKVRKLQLQAVDLLGQNRGPATAKILEQTASRHRRKAVRDRAAQHLKRLGVGEQIDQVARLLLDLQQTRSCSARAEIIRRLVEMGDQRTVAVMRRLRDERRGFFRTSYKNACIRPQLVDAIKQLLLAKQRSHGTGLWPLSLGKDKRPRRRPRPRGVDAGRGSPNGGGGGGSIWPF